MPEAYVERTQNELGAVITAPKLTEKLLLKPPFRFLHDIVTSFMKATAFPEGLFPDEMLDSGNVTEKEKKIEFLALLIAAIEAATGKKLGAHPSKIIAGQEAEKTNEMLQALASCAALPGEKKTAAVRKTKGNDGVQPAPVKVEAPEAKSIKDEEKERKEEKRKRKEEEKRRKEEEVAETAATEASVSEAQKKKQHEEKKAAARLREGEEAKQRKVEDPPVERMTEETGKKKKDDDEGRKKRKELSDTKSPKAVDDDDGRKRREKEASKRKEAPVAAAVVAEGGGSGTATGSAEKEEPAVVEECATLPAHQAKQGSRTATATAAGKAPPRTKPTHEVLEGTSSTSAPAPGVIREGKRRSSNVASPTEEDDDWMRIAEQQEAKPVSSGAAMGDDIAQAVEVKGYLGQQALKAKREHDEEVARRAQETDTRALRDGGIVIRSTKGGKNSSLMADGELSKLREQLQLLTKASNPLGKLLESIYDDIDTMARELEMWRSEAWSQALAAADARRQTTESLRELHAQLQNLDDAINDQILKTHNVRRNVVNNNNAIAGMVRMIVNPEITPH